MSEASAPSTSQKDHYVLPSQLCIGLHVHLDLSWTEHPFTFSSFQIRTQDQIEAIQALKLPRVRYAPDKSSSQPLPAPKHMAHASATKNGGESAPAAGGGAHTSISKQDLVSRLDAHVARMRTCESALANSVRTVKNVTKNVFARPAEAGREAAELVARISQQMPATSEIAIHLMSDKVGGEEAYQHGLNVAVLSMMLARELKLSDRDVQDVGMGALFHDIGKLEIDPKVARKADTLTRHEASLLQTHVNLGSELGKKLGLSPAALAVVTQHHECVDGTGYPKRMSASQINPLAKVAAIVNEFDKLCNPANPAKAMTPHEALSLLYGQLRARFDARSIATFVRCMGIYPPGTLVVLSNGALGMVVSVNSSRPLKPVVTIFDPAVRRKEAIVVDLEKEPDVSVVKTLRPTQLDTEAITYLAPRRRTTYYFDAPQGKQGA